MELRQGFLTHSASPLIPETNFIEYSPCVQHCTRFKDKYDQLIGSQCGGEEGQGENNCDMGDSWRYSLVSVRTRRREERDYSQTGLRGRVAVKDDSPKEATLQSANKRQT